MKKLFAVLMLVSGMGYAACNGPYCWDDQGPYIDSSGALMLPSFTEAQSLTRTPRAAGQIMYCSDCELTTVCVSTGTGNGAWVILNGTSTVSTAYMPVHCD